MDTTKLIADLRSQAPPPALQQLRAAVRHHIYTEAWTDIPQMERGMLSLAQDLYPRRSTPSRTEPEAHNDLSRCARRMWQLFRDMRSHQFTAQGLFTAWQQWTQFSRAHREHKQRAKARSKAGKLELLEQAHTAATQGDMQGVWKVVKTLAPKTKRKQLQLYKEGHIMSPTDEMKWIIQAFGERYGAREHNASFRLREHPPVHITEAEIHRQLGLLPVHKAVPPEAAPAALWRACVDETTPFIAREVNRQWSAPELMIQQEWADANVALLPKAKARTDSPLDWRPIGLQNPVGKTLMKILVARAKDQIHQLVMQCPQTAYVQSFEAAIRRGERKLGKQNHGVMKAKFNLAVSWALQDRSAEAFALWRGVLQDQLRNVGPFNSDTLATQRHILSWHSQVPFSESRAGRGDGQAGKLAPDSERSVNVRAFELLDKWKNCDSAVGPSLVYAQTKLRAENEGLPSIMEVGKSMGLTQHEVAAVLGWTTGDFRLINPIARGQEEVEFEDFPRGQRTMCRLSRIDVMPYVQVLHGAVQKLPALSSTQPLYRGHRREIDLPVGSVVLLPGFTSTSYDMDGAVAFAKQANQGRSAKRTLLVIQESFSGRLIAKLSARKYEAEVLFPIDSTFKVVETSASPATEAAAEATEELRRSMSEAEIRVVCLCEVEKPQDAIVLLQVESPNLTMGHLNLVQPAMVPPRLVCGDGPMATFE
eukprot:s5026_g1.t2